ncbi:type II toxin-antitoxin system MqsA family antitoxin [Nitrosospira multiformis]|nr:type II toxin-antitoxin system MqsA family antitoxin [Nitrosospira multiformis]
MCGRGELVREARDMPFTHKGHSTVIKNVQGKWCNHWGEGYFGGER